MQKAISIVRGHADETYETFSSRVKEIIEGLKNENAIRLSYTITLKAPPKGGVIPFSKEKIAVISIWSDKDDSPGFLQKQKGYSGTFKVNEALPVAYKKDWKDGEATPGVCLLTLFRQKKKIDYDTFIDRWFNGHTPLTLKIHPVYHYSRNQVSIALGDPPMFYDGIVEEHCRTRKDLINPFRFFTKSGLAIVNMIKTYFDVKSFIDYKSIETYLVAEYIVK